MGIYDRWDKFVKMAEENVGVAGTTLPPPAPWWADIPSYLDAAKTFVEVCILMVLLLWNFYLWLDLVLLWIR